MKKAVVFTVADNRNIELAKALEASLRKFHSEEELPYIIYGQDTLDKIQDAGKFYRATPLFAKELIKEYELVIKIDADSIIMGSLDYVLSEKYDAALVYNWNRVDPPKYGEIGLASIHPIEYFNCGFVAMRSKQFIDHWWGLCNSKHFALTPYREQGLLNLMAHYGDYHILRLDEVNGKHSAWYGLRNKGEGMNMILKDGKVILPKGAQGYPETDKEVKVYHFAGGENKELNFRTQFNEQLIKHIEWLIKN